MILTEYATKSSRAVVCHIAPKGFGTSFCGQKVPATWGSSWIASVEPGPVSARRIEGAGYTPCEKCHARLPEFEQAMIEAAAKFVGVAI